MNKVKKIALAVVAVIVLAVGVKAFELFGPVVNCGSEYKPKEGDIIFQETHGPQAPMIKAVTMSRWTHCGMVVMKNGKPHVVEAWKTCQVIPMEEWIARDGGNYAIARPKAFEGKDVKVKYGKYLGMPYDIQFRFDNGKAYCSELVWMLYKDITGEQLSEPRVLKTYMLTHISKMVENEIQRRGMRLDDEMVAPVDLMNTGLVERIY
ncbi:MAG: hypothetical protein II951_04495 [Bacteroidales bacterium]|nr:hypothetical protein [Bacteroidales bacterium]